MLIIESNGHNPDVNLLFNRYTLVRIEYLIGCDRAHGKTKKIRTEPIVRLSVYAVDELYL